jgi:hypothetical protein
MTQQFMASNISTSPDSKSSKIKNIIAFLAVTLFAVLVSLIFAPKAHATTYNVTPTSSCSLVEAFEAAATDTAVGACAAGEATLDTINVGAGTYTLAAAPPTATTDGDISVIGADATTTIIDGNGFTGFRLFSAGASPTLSISNLTLQNFTSSGAVGPEAVIVSFSGNLIGDNLIVRDNTCTDDNLPVCVLFGNGSTATSNTFTLTNSAFYNNSAFVLIGLQNGIFSGELTPGAGITLNLTNNTFSGNIGTILGLTNISPETIVTANVTNNTFASNTVAAAAVFYMNGNPDPQPYQTELNLLNNIFYQNLDANSDQATCPVTLDPSATITSLGGNISDDNTCATYFTATNDLNETDALISPLALDMGTYVRAINASSPAYNNAIASGAPSTDQRGVARPQGGGYDSGAYELVVPGPAPSPSPGELAPTGWDTRLPVLLATLFVLAGLTGVGYALKKN